MSSLGAQARAAELAAAVVAKRRAQAHREEEEQAAAAHQQAKVQRNLEEKSMTAPPPTNRVSLGAFVGPARTSKNNGAKKAWRPLHADDFDDDPNYSTGNEDNDDDDSVKTAPVTFARPTAPRLIRIPTVPSANQLLPAGYHQTSNRSALNIPIPHASQYTPRSLVPEDLSPTKQETKFDDLRGQNHSDDSLPSSGLELHSTGGSTENYPPFYDHSDYLMLGMQPENLGFVDFNGAEHPNYFTPLRRPQAITYQEKEPYNTKKAMQRFLAEQAEKSRTDKGKTVLCNPERKSGYNHQDNGRTSQQTPQSSKDAGIERASILTPDVQRARDALKANPTDQLYTPGLETNTFTTATAELTPSSSAPPKQQESVRRTDEGREISGEPKDDDRLLSDSLPSWFFELQPTMIHDERQLLKERLAKAARDLTVGVRDEPIISEHQLDQRVNVRRWFDADGRGQKELRSRTTNISVNHAEQHHQIAQLRNDGALPHGYKTGIDDQYASSLLLGEVACNIQTYLVGDQGSAEQRAKFNRVKPVPEWCTERKTMAEAGRGHSYFGTTWGTPPSRVARDPRFRAEVTGKGDREGLRKIGGSEDLSMLERLRLRRTQAIRRTG